MARFQVYTAGDSGAPSMMGQAGSLINVLDACLVNGYGSKPGAGWTKPFVNADDVGCYRIPTGSALFLSVADGLTGSYSNATGSEARITGYVTLSAVNVGTGAFPTSSQGPGTSTTSSFLIARKSTNASTTVRDWIIFADSRSLYAFINTGDTANTYHAFSFGDFYSFHTGSDAYNCMIVGRSIMSSSATTTEKLDTLSALTTATAGHFLASSYTQAGLSMTCSLHGDAVKGSTTALLGNITPSINGADSAIYLSSISICEPHLSMIRGRMRGFYQVLHPIANFYDRQKFLTGSGDFSGKSFQIVKQSGNSGIYCIEISDTLETN
jgi:hypothetical protein